MSDSSGPDRVDPPDEPGDRTANRPEQPDPDAPGSFVNDEDAAEIPEPNEPA